MKEGTKNKKMTIDKLAVMVAKGFDSIDNKFESIEKRMATKEDIKNLEKRLEKKIDNVENKLEGTNKRIDDLAIHRVKYEDHNKLKVRVDILEKTLNK